MSTVNLFLPNGELESIYSIISTFSGLNREWCFRFDKRSYSKRFLINSAQDLINKRREVSRTKLETHMSIQQFDLTEYQKGVLKTVDWTFIIDIDGVTDNDKIENMIKAKKLLNRYELFYLQDDHNHLWFPDWEHTLIPNWNLLYESHSALCIATYITKVSGITRPDGLKSNGGVIDPALWYAQRHPIRMPSSPHLKGGTQEFVDVGTLKRALELWHGTCLDKGNKATTYVYAKNFTRFIENAIKLGNEILLTEQEEEKEPTEQTPTFTWIEKLLKTPIPNGFRGKLLWLVIGRYLINVKKLGINESSRIVSNWLDICQSDRLADKDLYIYLTNTHKYLQNKGIMPCSVETLREKHQDIFRLLVEKSVFK